MEQLLITIIEVVLVVALAGVTGLSYVLMLNWPSGRQIKFIPVDNAQVEQSRKVARGEYKHYLYLKWSGRRGQRTEPVSQLFRTSENGQ